MMDEVKYQKNKYDNALKKLKEALLLNTETNSIVIDATIKRFEFTFEMAWKLMKLFLKYLGEECLSPRKCIKICYREGIINDEGGWLNLLEARNLTSHTYN